jgi:adenine-specific DNA-methyltransferase
MADNMNKEQITDKMTIPSKNIDEKSRLNKDSNRNLDKDKETALLIEIKYLKKKLEISNNRIKTEKYGITWLDVPEAFEEESENQLPILTEVKDNAIKNKDGKPTHILIEGDNYHSLTCLNYTHKNKIDLIYIDPPYNTGKDGFTYKDKRIIDKFPDGTTVPKDSPLRHSYWLSFMYKRLDLAKDLLKDTGKIVISIDDNEVANLVLLCAKVFGSYNQVAILPTVMNLKGNQDEFAFAGTHEYTVVFAKDISKCKFNQFDLDEEELEKWEEDEIGFYKKGANLKSTGENAPREKRANLFFPLLFDKETHNVNHITDEEYELIYNKETKTFDDDFIDTLKEKYEDLGFAFILPVTSGSYMTWRWSRKKMLDEPYNIIVNSNGDYTINKKQRPDLGDLPSKKPKTLFYKPVYSSGNGTNQLKNIVPNNSFKAPKPVDLIKDLIQLSTNKKSTVLDFFAGSGTTLHACLDLNNQGYKIQNIICTNNEGNICTEVTYPRSKNIIEGYKDLKKNKIQGLGNSLKYYKTDFVGSNNILSATDEDKSSLAHKAGYLLSIAENTLEEIELSNYYQLFENDKKVTAIYFKEEMTEMEAFLEKVENIEKPIALYLFSWGNRSEFEALFDHLEHITIKTIPQPILEIYKRIYNIVTV